MGFATLISKNTDWWKGGRKGGGETLTQQPGFSLSGAWSWVPAAAEIPLIGWASASQCSAQPLNWINEESHTGKKNKSIFKKISTRCVWNCNGENTWSQVISPPASHHLNFQMQGSKSTPPTAVNTQMDLNTIFWARSLQKKWKNAVVPMSEIMGWQPKAAQVLLNSQGI